MDVAGQNPPSMFTGQKCFQMHENDNVLIARSDLTAGEQIAANGLTIASEIPAGHKVAFQPISLDQPVIKFGQVIGYATRDIRRGEHVHEQNLAFREHSLEFQYDPHLTPTDYFPPGGQASFDGYRRANGKVGTRNYIGILTTVNCSATVARQVVRTIEMSGELDNYPNVDGVIALVHDSGCGMQRGGEGHRILDRVLKGYARHPNFAGVVLIGLGCEVAQVDGIVDALDDVDPKLFQGMTIQERGGTKDSIADALTAIRAMLPIANQARREPVPASALTLALQCGGSDGYSILGANPALGVAADLLVRHGGTAILSETPEIYGAEHLLLRRSASPEIAEALIARMKWWEDYTHRTGDVMDNNPAPGNKAGGLTTILEKALGSSAKGGSTNLVGVYEYAEKIDQQGLVFMDSPGFDPVSVTGQVAAGANLICFTTGRGSVFGFKPVPSIKIATNTPMYQRMEGDMDINCGEIIDGAATIEELGARIFDMMIAVASGAPSKSETLGFGDNEFVPWRLGAVM